MPPARHRLDKLLDQMDGNPLLEQLDIEGLMLPGDETDHPVDEAPFISFAWRPGLSLSARILQTCGAHVTVCSALGKGTTVVIVFP